MGNIDCKWSQWCFCGVFVLFR